MNTNEIVPVGREVDVGHAALTMAIGIIVERISRLPLQDQQELYELVKALGETKSPEDMEAIRVAMREILDDKACTVQVADSTNFGARPEKLQKWVDFVAEKVQSSRKAAGLTQVELADQSGLPQSHISRIESAKLSPSRATLERIAKALGRPVSDLDPSA